MGIIAIAFVTRQTDNPQTTITVEHRIGRIPIMVFCRFFYPLTYAIKPHDPLPLIPLMMSIV